MKIALIIAIALTLCLSACFNSKAKQEKERNIQKSNNMKNLISIVEIPTTDFSRAVKFYQTILGVIIEEVDMDGIQMGVLAGDSSTVSVVLVKGTNYQPTTDGAVIYLNAGNDLQPMLDAVEKNGGQTIIPKTIISPEMGYFALFIDPEGNKLGLHSSD